MFAKDSPQDLLLRGFSREYILDKTGTDVGYHGNAIKDAWRKVFMDALVAQGWQFKEELVFDNNQKSHFHRSNGNDKHEYESMLVFIR